MNPTNNYNLTNISCLFERKWKFILNFCSTNCVCDYIYDTKILIFGSKTDENSLQNNFITTVVLKKESLTFGFVHYRKVAVRSSPPLRKVWTITLIINCNINKTVWCSKLDYKLIKSECQHKTKLYILYLNQIMTYITVFKRYGFFRHKTNTIIYNA